MTRRPGPLGEGGGDDTDPRGCGPWLVTVALGGKVVRLLPGEPSLDAEHWSLDKMNPNDRFKYEYFLEIARMLRADPDRILTLLRRNIDKWRADSHDRQLTEMWERLLDEPIENIIATGLDLSNQGERIRPGPITGIISKERRPSCDASTSRVSSWSRTASKSMSATKSSTTL
jgi:hypothetical protein